MTRRPLLHIASIAATLMLVIAACSNAASQAPALTDPKEILAQTAASLKDVKTVELVGSLTGKVQAAELGGSLDLSSTTIAGAFDIPNQKGKLTIDAPALLSTKVEAIVVDGFAYVKIDGMLAGLAGLPSGKYVKTAVPQESGKPVTNPSEIAQGVEDIKAQLDKLPTPPTKLPDEKCGDVDCYHVQIVVSAADLAKLSPEAAAQAKGDYTIDIWSRKSDLRPAKLDISVKTEEMGTIGATFDLQVRRHGRRERAAGRPGHGHARRVAVPVARPSHSAHEPGAPAPGSSIPRPDEAACRAPTYNDPVSPASRRKPSGTRPDDAPESVGTAFLDVPASAGTGPDEPEWLSEAPLPGEQPPELSKDERRQLEAEQQATRERNAQRRAEEIVKRLNPEQARAVTTTEGPLLILAGAGSGKTRVLAHRIAYLIGVKNARPWSILAVTFTNRAAGELRERIISLVGEPGRDVQAGTFHSLCARVLRRDGEAIGISRRFVVYDTDDQQALMKQILREEDLPLTGEFRPSAVLGAISRAKNEMLDATFLAGQRGEPPRADDRPPRDALRGAPQAGPARSTSTTSSSRPSGSSTSRPRRSSGTRIAGATSTSTSTRTRTGRSTCGSGRSPRSTATSRSSATTTSRSTAGAAPTSGTSSTSSATTPTRRSSSSSATTARRS